jgi:hypothetical protein
MPESYSGENIHILDGLEPPRHRLDLQIILPPEREYPLSPDCGPELHRIFELHPDMHYLTVDFADGNSYRIERGDFSSQRFEHETALDRFFGQNPELAAVRFPPSPTQPEYCVTREKRQT